MAGPSDLTTWRARPTEALIAHILERYHATHRAQLPELVRLAEKVERVHADHTACPNGLAAHLSQMQRELESHMNKEEQVLFPMILRGLGSMTMGPISVMRAEHEDHVDAIARMRQLAKLDAVPADACTTWRALIAGIETLQSDLNAHMDIENEVLFPRFSS